jgi:uncharacterized membrane protein YfcA
MIPVLSDMLPTVAGVTLAFLAGGIVKGVISLGLPLIAVPLLMFVVDVKVAIALLMIPLVLSNLLQAVEGGGTIALMRRFWPLLVALAVGTLIGTALFAALDNRTLQLTIGPLAVLFAAASYLYPNMAVPMHSERWLAPVIGLTSGVMGGMTTFFGPALTAYVIGLHLGRDTFVKAIAIIYVFASLFLMLGGIAHGYAGPMLLLLSSVCMIPVYVGMRIGVRIRHRTDPEKFRLLVLGAVCLTGLNMIRLGLGF